MRSAIAPLIALFVLALAPPASAVAVVRLLSGSDDSLSLETSGIFSSSVSVTRIVVLVEGATGFTFDASNPIISLADSSYATHPLPGLAYDVLTIQLNTPTHTAASAFGYFTRFNPLEVTRVLAAENVAVLGPSLYDAFGVGIVPTLITEAALCDAQGCSTRSLNFSVPEPGAVVLLVSFVPFSLAQRGGKIRRRNGSVAAPT